jgi:hypothetical protein
VTYNRDGSLVESRDTIEFPLEKFPIKRKPAWCREILKETEKHSAPKGTFIESKKPDKYSGLIVKLNLVIDSEPSTFEEAFKTFRCGKML